MPFGSSFKRSIRRFRRTINLRYKSFSIGTNSQAGKKSWSRKSKKFIINLLKYLCSNVNNSITHSKCKENIFFRIKKFSYSYKDLYFTK